MSRDKLVAAFLAREPITVSGCPFTVINQLEHEDGSCWSFNVTGQVEGVSLPVTVYVRTRKATMDELLAELQRPIAKLGALVAGGGK